MRSRCGSTTSRSSGRSWRGCGPTRRAPLPGTRSRVPTTWRSARPIPPTEGLRPYLDDDSQVIVRPSGTEPKLKVYLEVIEPAAGGAAAGGGAGGGAGAAGAGDDGPPRRAGVPPNDSPRSSTRSARSRPREGVRRRGSSWSAGRAAPASRGCASGSQRHGWPIVRLDDFYLDGDDPRLPIGQLGIPDWDDPASWDLVGAVAVLAELVHTGSARLPVLRHQCVAARRRARAAGSTHGLRAGGGGSSRRRRSPCCARRACSPTRGACAATRD